MTEFPHQVATILNSIMAFHCARDGYYAMAARMSSAVARRTLYLLE
jgi:hypothetical protein